MSSDESELPGNHKYMDPTATTTDLDSLAHSVGLNMSESIFSLRLCLVE